MHAHFYENFPQNSVTLKYEWATALALALDIQADLDGQFCPVDNNEIAVAALHESDIGADTAVCSHQEDEVAMKSRRNRRGDPVLWKKSG